MREALAGPSVFPSREPGVSGDFWGRRKAVRDRFALQGGTGDFPGDAVAGKGLILPYNAKPNTAHTQMRGG